MIEITAPDSDRPATPDGPHDHEQTRAIADGIAEAVRLLNYATQSPDGLTYPADVNDVLGSLSAALGKLPQSLDQLAMWTGTEVAAGHARENASHGPHGGDAKAAATALTARLRQASVVAYDLAHLLRDAQSAVSGLESTREQAER